LKVKDGKVSKAATPSGAAKAAAAPAKAPRPIAKKKKDAIKAARMALATGKIASDEQERKLSCDLRTLFVRFKAEVPNNEGEVRAQLDNHPDIKFVRIPRQNQKSIRHAFVEFGSEAECEKAKELLTAGPKAKDSLYVDFVGVKSKAGGKPPQERGKRGKQPINPCRLFIKGLVDGLTEDKLKQLFPKSLHTTIPKSSAQKGGSKYAFVQFENPGDAKAAFDASQKLTISGGAGGGGAHHLTVLYATQSKRAVQAKQVQSAETKSSSPSKDKKERKKKQKATAKKTAEEDTKEEVKEEVETKDEEEGKEDDEDESEKEEDKEELAEDEKEEKEEKEDGDDDDDEDDDDDDDEEAEEEAEKKDDDDDNDDDDEDDDDEEEEEGDENMENDAESSEED